MSLKSSQVLKKVGECLYRNGNGIYFAWVKVKGKQIKRSLKTDDQALAKRRLAEFREQASRLHGMDDGHLRFEEFSQQWLDSIKPDLKPKSFERREVALKGLLPFFKGTPIRSIHLRQIEGWKKDRGPKISARSYNIELETLKQLLTYGCERGILLNNPAEKIKRRKQPQGVAQVPSKQEFSELLGALRESPWAIASGSADMVEFLAYSGMRVGEAREVILGDVNFERSQITVTGGANGTKNHQERIIPLFPNLKTLLERMLIENHLTDKKAKLFTIDSPRGAISNAQKRKGLKKHNVHSLRHFFATNAVEQNIPFKVIAEWLGHSDGGMLVAQRYGHLRDDFGEAMAARMSFQPTTDTTKGDI